MARRSWFSAAAECGAVGRGVHEPHAPDHGGLRGRPYAAIAMLSARSLRSPPPSPSFSEPAAVEACHVVNRADETSLREDVFLERHFSHGLFTCRARPEGVGALLKTSPSFDSGQTSTEWSQVTLAPLSGAGVSLEL